MNFQAINAADINLVLRQLRYPEASNKNVLHPKPLSHQMCRGITYVGTAMQQHANSRRWHGKIIVVLSKSFVATGYLLNTPMAIIEGLVTAALAAIALAGHILLNARSPLFQKITLKLCAHSLNSALITDLQVTCLKQGFFSKYHSLNAAASHAIHGISALIPQLIGHTFDRQAGRLPTDGSLAPSVIKAIRIALEIAPAALQDISRGLARDFSSSIRNNLYDNITLEIFLRQNPDCIDMLNRLNFESLRDIHYRLRLLNLVGSYLMQASLLEGYQNTHHIYRYNVNTHAKDIKYQTHILYLIKAAFIDLYDNEELVCLLSKEKDKVKAIEDGRELLETLYNINLQLANYAQLQELRAEIVCPLQFRAVDLKPYNARYQRLVHAKNCLNQLSSEEQAILMKKLLQLGSYDIEKQGLSKKRAKFVQQLFNEIGTLSGELHQGNLLSRTFVDVNILNQGDVYRAFGAENLFVQACQKAIQEIQERTQENAP
ncbi:hypothetical protein [Neochlamydia sp. S13]|uniref:hypothetical protein n=1 Tax=Neochlamydia sp. S13 TaxID=1353976 RepID=UPI0005A8C7B5|nr:hypothetical protein [Neochlamydia sp. S13]BBI16977.1 hypothetical protein NCS13_1_0782 [Neochlamydia sp. S13]